MIGNSIITQIGIIAVSLGIILTYIKPAFGDIKSIQDDITNTERQLSEVESTNKLLASIYANLNSISQANKNALFVYLPDKTDEVLVMKDLTAMAKDSEVVIKNLKFNEGKDNRNQSASTSEAPNAPLSQNFSVGILSTYEQLKTFLQHLEQNNYPLVVDKLTVKPNSLGLLDSEITITTYSHKE